MSVTTPASPIAAIPALKTVATAVDGDAAPPVVDFLALLEAALGAPQSAPPSPGEPPARASREAGDVGPSGCDPALIAAAGAPFLPPGLASLVAPGLAPAAPEAAAGTRPAAALAPSRTGNPAGATSIPGKERIEDANAAQSREARHPDGSRAEIPFAAPFVPEAAEDPPAALAGEGVRETPMLPPVASDAQLHAAATTAPAHASVAGAAPAARELAALHVPAPLAAPDFAGAFGERVAIAIGAGAREATISVNPPELGPVEMRVTVAAGEAHVVFAAEHAPTRAAIADALPALRELLAANGLQLAGSFVGAQLPQREALPAEAAGDAPPGELAVDAPPASARRVEVRLVDTFA